LSVLTPPKFQAKFDAQKYRIKLIIITKGSKLSTAYMYSPFL